MEKKYYNAPEVKFHQLMAKSTILAGSDGNNSKPGEEGADFEGDDQELGAKSFGSFSFDED